MIVLTLESPLYGTLDLNALASNTEGAQAQPGTSGLGLPSLDVQWVSGAGDGASYRGRRVLARDIDIPIEFVSLTRAGLITQMDNLSKILSDPGLILRATDSELGTNYYLSVHHVGGGDYITGQDTNGIYNMQLTVTVRAGNPFWVSNTATTLSQTNAAGIGPTITPNNTGTADTPAVWQFDGPGMNPKLTSPSGEVIEWLDFIPKGGKLIIDTDAGTVTDELGNNRYSALSAAPRFFKLKPGNNAVGVSFDRSSTDFNARANAGVLNRVLNPSFTNDAANWTLTRFARDATSKTIRATAGYLEASPVDNSPTPGGVAPYPQCAATVTVTGLTVGNSYDLVYDWSDLSGTPAAPAPTHGLTVTGSSKSNAQARITQGSDVTVLNPPTAVGTATFTFVATATSATIDITASRITYFEGSTNSQPSFFRGWYFYQTQIDNVAVVDSGSGFFSGDTTGAGYAYSWTGTANASVSKKVSTAPVDTSTAKLTCTFKPRKWMVV